MISRNRLQAFPRGLVEGLVVHAADVRYGADLDGLRFSARNREHGKSQNKRHYHCQDLLHDVYLP